MSRNRLRRSNVTDIPYQVRKDDGTSDVRDEQGLSQQKFRSNLHYTSPGEREQRCSARSRSIGLHERARSGRRNASRSQGRRVKKAASRPWWEEVWPFTKPQLKRTVESFLAFLFSIRHLLAILIVTSCLAWSIPAILPLRQTGCEFLESLDLAAYLNKFNNACSYDGHSGISPLLHGDPSGATKIMKWNFTEKNCCNVSQILDDLRMNELSHLKSEAEAWEGFKMLISIMEAILPSSKLIKSLINEWGMTVDVAQDIAWKHGHGLWWYLEDIPEHIGRLSTSIDSQLHGYSQRSYFITNLWYGTILGLPKYTPIGDFHESFLRLTTWQLRRVQERLVETRKVLKALLAVRLAHTELSRAVRSAWTEWAKGCITQSYVSWELEGKHKTMFEPKYNKCHFWKAEETRLTLQKHTASDLIAQVEEQSRYLEMMEIHLSGVADSLKRWRNSRRAEKLDFEEYTKRLEELRGRLVDVADQWSLQQKYRLGLSRVRLTGNVI